jgi:hypothetical protein
MRPRVPGSPSTSTGPSFTQRFSKPQCESLFTIRAAPPAVWTTRRAAFSASIGVRSQSASLAGRRRFGSQVKDFRNAAAWYSGSSCGGIGTGLPLAVKVPERAFSTPSFAPFWASSRDSSTRSWMVLPSLETESRPSFQARPRKLATGVFIEQAPVVVSMATRGKSVPESAPDSTARTWLEAESETVRPGKEIASSTTAGSRPVGTTGSLGSPERIPESVFLPVTRAVPWR